ncbi:hypothetical protein MRX96_041158 [Rhipicephalus microplus]
MRCLDAKELLAKHVCFGVIIRNSSSYLMLYSAIDEGARNHLMTMIAASMVTNAEPIAFRNETAAQVAASSCP